MANPPRRGITEQGSLLDFSNYTGVQLTVLAWILQISPVAVKKMNRQQIVLRNLNLVVTDVAST